MDETKRIENEGAPPLSVVERQEKTILIRLRTERDEQICTEEYVFGYNYILDFIEDMSLKEIEELLFRGNFPKWRPTEHQLWPEFCDFAEDEGLDIDKCYRALIKGVRDLYDRI